MSTFPFTSIVCLCANNFQTNLLYVFARTSTIASNILCLTKQNNIVFMFQTSISFYIIERISKPPKPFKWQKQCWVQKQNCTKTQTKVLWKELFSVSMAKHRAYSSYTELSSCDSLWKSCFILLAYFVLGNQNMHCIHSVQHTNKWFRDCKQKECRITKSTICHWQKQLRKSCRKQSTSAKKWNSNETNTM